MGLHPSPALLKRGMGSITRLLTVTKGDLRTGGLLTTRVAMWLREAICPLVRTGSHLLPAKMASAASTVLTSPLYSNRALVMYAVDDLPSRQWITTTFLTSLERKSSMVAHRSSTTSKEGTPPAGHPAWTSFPVGYFVSEYVLSDTFYTVYCPQCWDSIIPLTSSIWFL